MKLLIKWQMPGLSPEFCDFKSHSDKYDDEDEIFSILCTVLDPEKDLKLTTINFFHLVLGTILIGFIAMFQMIYYVTFPHGSIFGRRRGNMTGWILLLLILFGVAKVFTTLYTRVKSWSQRRVEIMESVILDVN